jgi:hypothetical protein
MSRATLGKLTAAAAGCALLFGGSYWFKHKEKVEAQIGTPKPEVIDRDRVKSCLDSDAHKIAKQTQKTTLGALLKIARPADLPRDGHAGPYADTRIPPVETTVWRIEARLKEIVEREDGDLYLVLEDKGSRTVAEVPPFELNNRFHGHVEQVRKHLETRFKPTRQPRPLDLPIIVEGVGFFGRASSGNGARLHPVTSVQFP